MKYSYDPTDENVLKLYEENSIHRREEVLRFVRLLSNINDDCYSIAINGEWGSGKTFFVKQVKLVLDALNRQSRLLSTIKDSVKCKIPNDYKTALSEDFVTVYYDAWEYDNHDDPVLSLIYATIKSGQTTYDLKQKPKLIACLGAIADIILDRDVSSLIDKLKGEDTLAPIFKQENLKDLVKDFFDTLITESGSRLVFFVDELDRCKPDYAVRLLERIKHYFNDSRITFVFSVNMHQLQHTVRRFYGSEFNSTRYLDKYFDLRLSIPSVNYNDFICKHLAIGNDVIDTVCIATAKYFKFSLRETERYMKLMNIVRSAVLKLNNTNLGAEEVNAVSFSATYFVPITIALHMYDIDAHTRFISGKDKGPLIEILKSPDILKTMDFFSVQDKKYMNEYNRSVARTDGGRLIEILDKPDIRESIGYLNNYDNAYNEGSPSVEGSNVENMLHIDRICRVYQALYPEVNSSGDSRWVGHLCFTEKVRIRVEEIAALLHPYTDYNKL